MSSKDKKVKEIIASNLKKYRKINNYTQKELANQLGLKHNTISAWESGANSIDIDVLVEICDLFKLTLNDMYRESEFDVVSINETEKKLLNLFNELNIDGKNEAQKRIEELTLIPHYTNKAKEKQSG